MFNDLTSNISFSHYVQTIQVSIFPTEEYAIVLDRWYEYKDHFGRTMKAFATDDGNVVHSIMLDGPVGPLTSVIELINDELYLTTIIDKQNVKAIRILHRVWREFWADGTVRLDFTCMTVHNFDLFVPLIDPAIIVNKTFVS